MNHLIILKSEPCTKSTGHGLEILWLIHVRVNWEPEQDTPATTVATTMIVGNYSNLKMRYAFKHVFLFCKGMVVDTEESNICSKFLNYLKINTSGQYFQYSGIFDHISLRQFNNVCRISNFHFSLTAKIGQKISISWWTSFKLLYFWI